MAGGGARGFLEPFGDGDCACMVDVAAMEAKAAKSKGGGVSCAREVGVRGAPASANDGEEEDGGVDKDSGHDERQYKGASTWRHGRGC